MADPVTTTPLHSGGFGSATFQFWICLAFAIGIVFLFCRKKFDERTNTVSEDYVYQLAPSQLATGQEYMRGFLIYFVGISFVVAALSLIGAKNSAAAFGLTIPPAMNDVVWPIGAALVVVGLLPNLPLFQELEKWGRQYAHEVAYIPRSALAIAERLSTAGFDFSLYADEAMQSEEMRGVEPDDFKKPRRSIEYAWARLGCLVYVQNSVMTSDTISSVDTEFLQAYRRDLDLIHTSKKAMESEVAAYRVEKGKNPGYTNDALNRAIRNELYKLYILLGCAVRIKNAAHGDINLPLQRLGFQLEPGEAPRSNHDLILVGIAACAAAVLVIQFAAVVIGNFNVWDTSILFPPDYLAVLYNTGWSLIPFGVAIIAADTVRKRGISRGWWFTNRGGGKVRNFANYVRAGLICGIAGYLGLMLWDSLPAAPTKEAFALEVPNALLSIVTGAFYVWHLDTVELGERRSPVRAVVIQFLVTGVCAFMASSTSWNIKLPQLAKIGITDVSLLLDLILLTTLMSAAVGGVLAWYVPAAAAAAKVDPLVEAMDERFRKLEMVAAARLGDADAATRWMDQPQAALEQQSPRQAARDVDGFEHAMSLLQSGPRAVAA